MQSLTMNNDQLLCLMQLAKSMPNYKINPIYNPNSFFSQAYNNYYIGLNRLHQSSMFAVPDFKPNFYASNPFGAYMAKSEPIHNVPSASPSMTNSSEENTYDIHSLLKYEEDSSIQSITTEETETKEEYCGISNQSKKINKEKIRFRNSQTKHQQSLDSLALGHRTRQETWKEEEDALLLELYKQYGPKWASIGKRIGNKSGKQTRDRYLNTLRPGIKQDAWTAEEEKLFESLVERYGKKWCVIASEIPGRTENQVKNKYYCMKSKASRKDRKKLSLTPQGSDCLEK